MGFLLPLFPFLDILGCLKNALKYPKMGIGYFFLCKRETHGLASVLTHENTHKNPKFGIVRQVPIWELSWEFPGWDLSHFAKYGIFMGIL